MARLEPDLNSGCWLWSGANNGRYGQISISGRLHKTHTIMFEEAVRPLRPGEITLHRCDTPACCNPDHLFAGTQKDNMIDRAKKGRNPMQTHPENSSLHYLRFQPRGVSHHLAKLTPEIAAAIRSEYLPGATKYEPEGGFRWLARKYGVSDKTISNVIHGKTWSLS
jgi:hypothetical protein